MTDRTTRTTASEPAPKHLRFTGLEHDSQDQRPERWTQRHSQSILGGRGELLSSTSRTSLAATTLQKRRLFTLKKQGSLFATAAEDIVEEKNGRHLYLVYKLEGWLSNRQAQYLTLILVGLSCILVSGCLWMLVQDELTSSEDHPFIEGIWVAWTFMADPGTHADVVKPTQRIVAALIAVLGIIFFAALLGVVVDVIRNKMDLLRQGRSRVVERNHSLILGWTEKSILLIEELCVANQSEGGGVIVVMAKNGKQDMEDEMRCQLPAKHLLGSKVVFRSGSPLLTHDLIKVGAHKARSIIILAGDNEPNQADAETLRCILVLRTMPYGLTGFIVAEVRDISNEPLLKMVGGSVCETVPSHDILGRLMLMAGRSPGLAKVYESLLGFEGDEFYMWEWPELEGLTFGELLGRFPDAIPIGLRTASGALTLNPHPDTALQKGDKLIVIAEDDDTYRPEPPANIDVGTPPPYCAQEQKPELIFVAGWRRDISDILVHLDNLVVKGSVLHVMTHCVSLDERVTRLEDEGMDLAALQNLQIVQHFGNTTVRRKLETVDLEQCTSCMIFADQAFELDTMHADSHSLATLLLIRDTQMMRMEDNVGTAQDDLTMKCPIVCEILDPRTQKTIAGSVDVQHSSEFCHSNLMIAQIMAMVSENRTVKDLLDEMLGYKGCSVAVIPANRFAHRNEKVSFWVVAKRAMAQHQCLLGYRTRGAIDPPFINPRDKRARRAWDGFDLVVLGPGRSSTSIRPKALRNASVHPDGSVVPPEGTDPDLHEMVSQTGELNRVRRSCAAFAGHQDPSRGSVTKQMPACDEESLEAKVLKLVEAVAALDDGERKRMGQVLDGLRDVVGSLPARGAQTAYSKRMSVQPQRAQSRNLAEAALHSLQGLCQQEPMPQRLEHVHVGDI